MATLESYGVAREEEDERMINRASNQKAQKNLHFRQQHHHHHSSTDFSKEDFTKERPETPSGGGVELNWSLPAACNPSSKVKLTRSSVDHERSSSRGRHNSLAGLQLKQKQTTAAAV